jgi:hypothetical protein
MVLATPPSTVDVAADSEAVLGPSTTLRT